MWSERPWKGIQLYRPSSTNCCIAVGWAAHSCTASDYVGPSTDKMY